MSIEPKLANQPAPDLTKELAAVRRSVARAMLRHKLLRQPIWVDGGGGTAKKVEPDEIVTGLTPEEEAEEIETAGHGTWFSE